MADIFSNQLLAEESFFRSFYEKYYQFVYQQAWKYVPNSFEADDLVQDVWEKLYLKCALFRSFSHKQQIAYIAVAVRNTALSNARRKRDTLSLDELTNLIWDNTEILDDLFDRRIRMETFRTAWPKVPAPARELLERKYILMESDMEIAQAMAISRNSVRMYLTRARKQAYSVLSQYDALAAL